MNIANLSQDLQGAGSDIRILPNGVFRTGDGRPKDIPGWRIDSAIAARVIASSLVGADLLIDYDHQSCRVESNGQPAPAAGWFNRLEWREGSGMFALGIQWNDKAKAMIAAREYRYISPVFSFDPITGDVLRILSVAITNNPALPGLMDLSTIAVNSGKPTSIDPQNQRGMEMLRRMNEENDKASARLNANAQTGKAKTWESMQFLPDAEPGNQRGMEVLQRMAAENERMYGRR